MVLDRRAVLAYRMAAQGLHRDEKDGRGLDAPRLDVLDLGVQDTTSGSAAMALAIRLGRVPPDPGTDDRLATTWTFRGAPHVQRRTDLVALSRALWPVSDDDALVRFDTSASPVRRSGLPPRGALRLVAGHLADVVRGPVPKGEASGALTRRIPEQLTVDCRRCRARHIVESLFRAAVLPAGLAFVPSERTVTFTPLPDWPGVPDDVEGLDRVLRAYLHLHGPTRPVDAAGFLGTRQQEIAQHWPDDLVEVQIDGRASWVLTEDAELLQDPPDPPRTRLLPPADPFLQARDREVLLPDAAQRKTLWPTLGRPGALVVDGEIAGTWRGRKRGSRLALTIGPFGHVPRSVRRHLEVEAELLAAARRASTAEVEIA